MTVPTSSNLSIIAGQILDKLAEMVNAPVLGTVTAAATSGTVHVLQGMLGTLADGRLVRVRASKRSVGTLGATLSVRLLLLTPAYPAANNFAKVLAGATVTWINPPAGLAPTATVQADFAANATVMSSGAPVAQLGSVAEFQHLQDPGELFDAGANGTTIAVLQEPEVEVAGFGQLARRRHSLHVATWPLRINLGTLAGERQRRASARDVHDALTATLLGAKAGSWEIWFKSWKRAQGGVQNIASRELAFTTHIMLDGRVQQPTTQPALTDVHVDSTVNDNGTQPSPFHVITDVPVT